MASDKAFGIYAVAMIGMVASVITASVMAGFATFPSLLVFLEHIALSLLFRAAYKSLDGPYGLFSKRVEEGASVETLVPAEAAEAEDKLAA